MTQIAKEMVSKFVRGITSRGLQQVLTDERYKVVQDLSLVKDQIKRRELSEQAGNKNDQGRMTHAEAQEVRKLISQCQQKLFPID